MWWIAVAVVAVLVVVYAEWRSRNRPLVPGMRDHWSTHSAALNDLRPLTGGHGEDERR